VGRAKIAEEYGATHHPLKIVAITLILDWYHLGKKVTELMSMIASNKQEQELHLQCIFRHLWRGQVTEVVEYLNTQVRARNPER